MGSEREGGLRFTPITLRQRVAPPLNLARFAWGLGFDLIGVKLNNTAHWRKQRIRKPEVLLARFRRAGHPEGMFGLHGLASQALQVGYPPERDVRFAKSSVAPPC